MPVSFSLSYSGSGKLTQQIERLVKLAPVETAGVLFEEAEDIMAESQKQVPFRTGVLSGSGHVQPPVIDEDGAEVVMGYGGPARAYAIIQHETKEFRHAEGRKWKYLEDPAMEAAEDMETRFGQKLQARFQRKLSQ